MDDATLKILRIWFTLSPEGRERLLAAVRLECYAAQVARSLPLTDEQRKLLRPEPYRSLFASARPANRWPV